MLDAVHDHADGSAARGADGGEVRRQHKVFAARAALTFEMGTMRATDRQDRPLPAINIDAAPSLRAGVYDWANKRQFQVGYREIPVALGTILGYRAELELTGHGVRHDKTLRIKAQPAGVQFIVRQKAEAISVPVGHLDVFAVAELFIAALLGDPPCLSSETIVRLAARACALVPTKPDAQPPEVA